MKLRHFFLALPLAFMTVSVYAEDPGADKFYQISTGWSYDSGRLKTWVYEYSKIWLNGVRQSDETYFYLLRPGDELQGFICGDTTNVDRYRLNRLTPTRAWFTHWMYAVVISRMDEGGVKFGRGRLVSTESFEVDLTQPNGVLVDYGPNYVSAGNGITGRSKHLWFVTQT